ncbi:MAG TPA: poly-gamma-glutamate hydrolase family protein [Thermodesulfobacteriota bacterium]|nr:poly-gamma-glutamate hydrolase family protein [Thermodesulfobacteriota bacterium]
MAWLSVFRPDGPGETLHHPLRTGWTFPGSRMNRSDEMISYRSFKELSQHEVEGQGYRIRIEVRDPRVLIMAPHGGKIEPMTAEISEAIAGGDFSFYNFEGLKTDGNSVLHIESHLFDEPRGLKVVEKADIVITVHGRMDQKDEFVMTGGLHTDLRLEIERQLQAAGFQTRFPTEGLMGTDPLNICNRGRRGQGVQLEASRKVRDLLKRDGDRLRVFAKAVRRAIGAKGEVISRGKTD